jgi:hypothetical protein
MPAINPRNTSRTYPACNHVSAENRKTQSKFECVECGYQENAVSNRSLPKLSTSFGVEAVGIPCRGGKGGCQHHL